MFLYYSLFVALIVIADQVAKYFTVLYIPTAGAQPFIPGILQITYVRNTGAAFSSPQATVTRAGQGSHINERILWTSRQKRSITTGSGAL